jgi:glycosyltransferase involved in cell wall biosynthesis
MKILKIIHGYPPNYNAGSEVYSQSICDELSKQHDVTVFTREENPYLPDFHIRQYRQHDKLQFYFVNMPRGKDGYRHQEIDDAFSNLLSVIQPDVTHIGHLNHLSTGLVDELSKQNIPIVFTLHDFWLMCPRGQFLQRNFGGDIHQLCNKQENHKCATTCYSMYFTGREEFYKTDVSYWTKWIDQRMRETKSIADKTDLFIAPSKHLMQRFTNDFNIPQEKITYLDYGFPLHYLTPNTKKKSNSVFTFGYIGTHIPAKGVNLLIEAFKKIGGEARLLIWGWKDQQSTKALMSMAENCNAQIEFRNEYINKNLADEVFSEVDCIVVPSIWEENSPLVIHEAQACHIPVITADFGGMAEYVQHKVNGLLFKHRDENNLAKQMQWAVEHPQEMKKFGEKGYLFSEDGKVPDISHHCEALIKLYKKIIKQYATATLADND